MKVYRAHGDYYEKQADVPKGTKFETVEFPFNASPKSDFVAWLNERNRAAADYGVEHAARCVEAAKKRMQPTIFHHDHDTSFLNEPLGVAQPQPTQPVQPQSQIDRNQIEDLWPTLPLAFQFHLCAATMEAARNTDFFGTAPAKAPQGFRGRDNGGDGK